MDAKNNLPIGSPLLQKRSAKTSSGVIQLTNFVEKKNKLEKERREKQILKEAVEAAEKLFG